jgi:hypothetical protein
MHSKYQGVVKAANLFKLSNLDLHDYWNVRRGPVDTSAKPIGPLQKERYTPLGSETDQTPHE